MMMPGFSIADWMSFYSSLWREEILFASGETLKQKLDRIEKRLSLENKGPQNQALIIELRKEVYGELDVEYTPYDFQIEALILDLKYSADEWNNLSNEEKGKILATKTIQSDFETVAKFESALKANLKKGSNSGKSKS